MTLNDREIESGGVGMDDARMQSELSRISALRDSGALHQALAAGRLFAAECVRRTSRLSYFSQCALSQLGRTYRAIGGRQFREAERLHWEVLDTRLREEGKSSPRTANSAHILADTLELRQKRSQAAAVRRWSQLAARPSTSEDSGIRRVEARLRRIAAFRDTTLQRRAERLINAYLSTHP